MVDGPATQVYAEDRINLAIEDRFTMLVDEYWWPDLCVWAERTLDGTLGVITSAVTGLTSIGDALVYDQDGFPIPLLPDTTVPFQVTGTKARYYSAHEDQSTNILQFWPKTSTGTIFLRVRQFPDTINDDTVLKVDSVVLGLMVSYDIARGDGTNPTDIAGWQTAADNRLNQLKRKFNTLPRAKNPGYAQQWPTEWFSSS